MKERLVWRLNNISPEQWEKLSRDEQIRCWQEREAQPVCPPSHPSSFVKLYQQGILTAHEFALDVFESLTEENGTGFLETCPENLLSLLQERAAAYPDAEDNEAWRQIITIRTECHPPWVPTGQASSDVDEEQRRSRNGLRIFRSIMARRDGRSKAGQ